VNFRTIAGSSSSGDAQRSPGCVPALRGSERWLVTPRKAQARSGTMLNGQALIARKMVLQVAERDIGQLTDI
jgi:hypothetical protein